jgi:rhodanese-related sulfurtransferase
MTYRMISPNELYEKMKKGENTYLLDVRAEEKFNDFHIEGPEMVTHNVSKTKILDGGEELTLPTEGDVIVTCTTGNSAAKCAAILSKKDDNILVLEGGITAWKEFLKTL